MKFRLIKFQSIFSFFLWFVFKSESAGAIYEQMSAHFLFFMCFSSQKYFSAAMRRGQKPFVPEFKTLFPFATSWRWQMGAVHAQRARSHRRRSTAVAQLYAPDDCAVAVESRAGAPASAVQSETKEAKASVSTSEIEATKTSTESDRDAKRNAAQKTVGTFSVVTYNVDKDDQTIAARTRPLLDIFKKQTRILFVFRHARKFFSSN